MYLIPLASIFQGGGGSHPTQSFFWVPSTYWMCPLRQNTLTSPPPVVAGDPRAKRKGRPEILPGGGGVMSGRPMELYCQSLKPASHAIEGAKSPTLNLSLRSRECTNREDGIDAGTRLARRGLCSRRGTRDQVYQSSSASLATWDVEGSDQLRPTCHES